MKQIFPTTKTSLTAVGNNPITKQQYDELVCRTNCAECKADIAVCCVNSLVNCNTIHKATGQFNNLTACNVNANCVNANNVEANCTTINEVSTCNIIAECGSIGNITTNDNLTTIGGCTCLGTVNANELNSPNASIDCVNSCTITAAEGTISNLTADNATITHMSLECPRIGTATITCADIEESNIGQLTANDTTTCTLQADSCIDTPKLRVNYIIHDKLEQEVTEVADTGDYWIVLPQFTNGVYFIEAKNDTNKRLWSIEIQNSIKNVQFRWSERQIGYLQTISWKVDAAGVAIVQIKANSLNEHVTLYSQSISTNNDLPPSIYSSEQITEADGEFTVTQTTGTFIQDVIFTNKLHADCIEMDALMLDNVGIYRKLFLSCDFNIVGDIIEPIVTEGTEGQYITNKTICGLTVPTWESRADRVDSTKSCLVNSDTVAAYDGTDYAGTYECDVQTKLYPITNLGDNTCVHGSVNVECDVNSLGVCAECIRLGKTFEADGKSTCVVDQPMLSNTESADWEIYDKAKYGVDYLGRRQLVTKDCCDSYNCECNYPLVYNENMQPKQCCEIKVETAEVACDLHVRRDLFVGNDLYVCGTTHTVESETISTASDTLILRQNNPAGLASGEVSGVIINNYNGTESLAIVTDSSGTLRIGDVTCGQTTTYQLIYYKDGHWYDAPDGTEITVTGELVKYSSKSIEDGYTKYTNAVFTVFSYECLQPILSRDETANLNANGLFVWNGVTHEANTISLPTSDGQTLHYNGVTCSYYWEKDSGVYCFESVACYEAVASTIPLNSVIMIADACNYTISEEIE